MAWSKSLEASLQGGANPGVRVAVLVSVKGKTSLVVSVGKAVMQEVGLPKRANAWLGDGDEAGRILMQFDNDGELEVKCGAKGGGALRLALPPEFKPEKRKHTVCQYEVLEGEGGVAQLLVVLPQSIMRPVLKKAA